MFAYARMRIGLRSGA